MREHLLGYLLGALDDSEHEAVRESLEKAPQVRHEFDRLTARLAPLRAARQEYDPPAGLAARTCALIDREREKERVTLARGRGSRGMASESTPGRFSLADLIVACGVILAVAMLFFPAIASSRYHSRLAGCQGNLRKVGVALSQYSRLHHGYFPFVPSRGKMAAAGVYAPILVDGGFLSDGRVVVCPASPLGEAADGFRVPSLDQLWRADGRLLRELQQKMGGSYGYNLGHVVSGRVRGTRDRGRAHFVLMSDSPNPYRTGDNSDNHGGYGQNVLFENGRVRYLVTCREDACGDNFFVNDRGRPEAGLHRNDAVVGGSATPPLMVTVAPGD